MRRDIAKLLETGQEATARIRVCVASSIALDQFDVERERIRKEGHCSMSWNFLLS